MTGQARADGEDAPLFLHVERSHVQPGDVLVAVNGTPVGSVDDVRSIVSKSDKSVALLIQRGSERIFVPVRVG
jgi:serine protease Do